mgnify:FL=1
MTAPARYNFRVFQGQTWNDTIAFTNDADDTPIDLTGFTARMQVRADITDANVILELTTGNGKLVIATPANGQLQFNVSATDMAALPCNYDYQAWPYDLELVNGSVVSRKLEGMVIISPEVTR